MHKTRYAWCSHVSHHSSQRYNLSTALRQNFLFDISGLALLWVLNAGMARHRTLQTALDHYGIK